MGGYRGRGRAQSSRRLFALNGAATAGLASYSVENLSRGRAKVTVYEESAHCKAFVQWAYLFKIAGEGMPKDATVATYLWHTPNEGERDISTGGQLRAEGVKAGVYDYTFALPRGKYHGAFLEMKSAAGVLSADQKKFGANMRGVGYYVTECFSWEVARQEIQRYLQLGPFRDPRSIV